MRPVHARAVHACNRFSPPSISLVRSPVKINKGTINKNYTFFISPTREEGKLGAFSDRGCIEPNHHPTLLLLVSSLELELPPPLFLSFFPFSGKEKERKEIFFDRCAVFQGRRILSTIGLIGVLIFSNLVEQPKTTPKILHPLATCTEEVTFFFLSIPPLPPPLHRKVTRGGASKLTFSLLPSKKTR